MSTWRVASESGRRPALPELASAASQRAEVRAGLRWAGLQLAGRAVLVIAPAALMPELDALTETEVAEVLLVPADPIGDTSEAPPSPIGIRHLGGSLRELPAVEGATALLWLGAPRDPGELARLLDLLLTRLPPDPPLVIGFGVDAGDVLEYARAALPGARLGLTRSIATATVHGEGTPASGEPPLEGVTSRATYVTTVAADGATSDRAAAAVDLPTAADWLQLAAELDARIASLEAEVIEGAGREDERRALQRQLVDAETELAQLPLLREELEQLRHDRDLVRQALAGREAHVAHVEGVLADVTGSLSWRVTRPLRALWRLGRRTRLPS